LVARRTKAAIEDREGALIHFDLIEDDDGREPIRLRDHEEAIEHAQIGLRILGRRDHDHLVHIRCDRLRAATDAPPSRRLPGGTDFGADPRSPPHVI
jgi:hypothetical protein